MNNEATSRLIRRSALTTIVRRKAAFLAIAACAVLSLAADRVRLVLILPAAASPNAYSELTVQRTTEHQQSVQVGSTIEDLMQVPAYASYANAPMGPGPYSIGDVFARAGR